MSAAAKVLEKHPEMTAAAPQPQLSIFRPAQPAPTWFYGWLMLPLATLMMVATSPGQTFGVAYFNTQFLAEFALTKTSLSVVYLVATLLAALAIPYVGGLIDRFGLRRAALCAVSAMAAACFFASQMNGLATMLLSFLALRLAGPCTLTLLANNTLAAWFDVRLGQASSLTQVAMAGVWAIVPVVFVLLIDSLGWRGAYLVLGGLMLSGLLPLLAILYRQSPSDLGQMPDGFRADSSHRRLPFTWGNEFTLHEAMQHRSYWILVSATAMWALIGTGLIFHLPAVFESVGLDAKSSTHAVSGLALVMGATQLVAGLLADRLAMRWLLVSSMTLLTIACVLLAESQTLAPLVAGYVVFGCSQGLMTIVASTAWARYFGRTHLGKIRGTSLTAAVGASAMGPVVMGVSADYLGGFAPSFWLFAAMMCGIVLLSFWATPPRDKLRPSH
jgi:OFA family oxalate/formate antiporter-like MFS transporter